MQWRNNDVRLYLRNLTDAKLKKQYESTLDDIRATDRLKCGNKVAVLINGVRHDLHHLTRGSGQVTVTVFYDWIGGGSAAQPIIWGLGQHNGSNTEYMVKWNSGSEQRVSLPRTK